MNANLLSLNKFYLIFFYIFTVYLFINFNSFLSFWINIEVNMLSFILIIKSFKCDININRLGDRVIYYFFIQSTGSLIYLRLSSFLRCFTFEITTILILSLLLKLGLPPLCFWVYNLRPYLGVKVFTLLIRIQKLPVIVLLFFLMENYQVLIIFVLIFWGTLNILVRTRLTDLIISSSIYFTRWLFFIFINSYSIFILLYAVYTLFFFIVVSNNAGYRISNMFYTLISYIFFIGLPPLSLFFFKFISLNLLINSDLYLLIFIIIITFIATCGYFKFFFVGFKYKVGNYEYRMAGSSSILALSIFIILIFLLFWGKLI